MTGHLVSQGHGPVGIVAGGVRLGPFWLAPGISRLNAMAYFYSSFANILLITFLNFLQPYLINDVLHLPAERQGAVTGTLSMLHETISLVLFGVVGAASDRMGRRNLCALGLVLLAVGLVLIPLATAEWHLFMYRAVFACGVATASVAILAAFQDYPQEVSRGRWSGMNSVATSLAILVLSLVGVRLPQLYQAAGADPVLAGKLSFWSAAALGLASAVVVRLGYHAGNPATAAARRPSIFSGMLAAVSAARGNPKLALAYACAFAVRGDMMVIGAFLSLWFIRAGAEQGLGSAAALAKFGVALGVFQLVLMTGAPLIGWLTDRIDRVRAVAIAMTVAASGYFAVGAVTDPYAASVMLPAMALLAFGEIAAIIAGSTLLGQESPMHLRGATAGAYGFCGTLGVLFATGVGGVAFDSIAYSMPFTMMACVNGAVAVLAVVMLLGQRRRRSSRQDDTRPA